MIKIGLEPTEMFVEKVKEWRSVISVDHLNEGRQLFDRKKQKVLHVVLNLFGVSQRTSKEKRFKKCSMFVANFCEWKCLADDFSFTAHNILLASEKRQKQIISGVVCQKFLPSSFYDEIDVVMLLINDLVLLFWRSLSTVQLKHETDWWSNQRAEKKCVKFSVIRERYSFLSPHICLCRYHKWSVTLFINQWSGFIFISVKILLKKYCENFPLFFRKHVFFAKLILKSWWKSLRKIIKTLPPQLFNVARNKQNNFRELLFDPTDVIKPWVSHAV